MTERIDHADEAVNFLRAVTYDTHGDDDRKVALAQVHATLALVEQQRIANILAASDYAWRRWGNYAPISPVFEHGLSPSSNMRYTSEIREGLGL